MSRVSAAPPTDWTGPNTFSKITGIIVSFKKESYSRPISDTESLPAKDVWQTRVRIIKAEVFLADTQARQDAPSRSGEEILFRLNAADHFSVGDGIELETPTTLEARKTWDWQIKSYKIIPKESASTK